MKKYEYNVEFLRSWMEQNKKMKKDVLEILDIQSYEMVRRWREGEAQMKTENILSFCNATGISPAKFFLEDGHALSPDPEWLAGANSTNDNVSETALRQELLQIRLEHQMELNALQNKYQEREDRIRKDYDDKIQRLIDRIPKAKSQSDFMDVIGGMTVNEDLASR